MSFADIPDTTTEYKRTEYVKITAGVPLKVRILDKKAIHVTKHYIPSQRISILCLGEEVCPICQSNSKLMRENPGLQPRQIKGFIPRQNRYMVNVLNRTMVKLTPSENVVYASSGAFPSHHADTGELLLEIEAQPLNHVQVLERGPTLFAQLNSINDAVTDEAGNPLGLDKFDVTITATGSGRRMTTNIIPHPDQNEELTVPDEDRYTLETLGIQLTPDEILSLLRGVSLRDIFETRRVGEEIETLTDTEGKVSEDVKENIESLFDN